MMCCVLSLEIQSHELACGGNTVSLAKLALELGSDAAGKKKVYPGVDSLFIITKTEILATQIRANIDKWCRNMAHYV